jgi:hypothetical protein
VQGSTHVHLPVKYVNEDTGQNYNNNENIFTIFVHKHIYYSVEKCIINLRRCWMRDIARQREAAFFRKFKAALDKGKHIARSCLA